MSDPLVSVDIITYNQRPYIAQALEGALRQQTDFDVEILVGEDCSTDGTRDVVREYQRRHPERLRVITSDHNVGPRQNCQRVWAASRGKYIAFCDGDDYWTDPGKLQKQVEFLETHPEYSLCCHDVEVIHDGVPKTEDKYVEFPRQTFSFDDAIQGHFVPTLSLVYRRALLATTPPWMSECRSVDLLIALLLLDQGPGYYFHETMGVKRDNPGSISRIPVTKETRIEDSLRMYQRTDVYTQGRHRDILRWKIARLSLTLAGQHWKDGRLAQSCKYAMQSIRYDWSAIPGALRRRLAPGGSMGPSAA